MTMTKGDFEALAAIVRASSACFWTADGQLAFAQHLAKYYAAHNPRFDPAKFINACISDEEAAEYAGMETMTNA